MAVQERPTRRRAAILERSTAFRGPSQLLAFGAGISQPSSYPLSNQAALKFSHGPPDSEDHPARGRARVSLFGKGDNLFPAAPSRFGTPAANVGKRPAVLEFALRLIYAHFSLLQTNVDNYIYIKGLAHTY